MQLEGSEMNRNGESGGTDNPDIPAAITDTGCERDLNEDRYAVIESPSGLAWLVCDGMGGQTGGELAAQLAIDAMRRDLENLPERPPELALKSAILEANRVIVLRRQNQAFSEMGTTIVAALFSGIEVVIGYVGDSRAYLIRDGAIQQLTTDHTYVQQLVDSGQIRPDEALAHPQAHILTRCIGAEPGLEVEIQKYWIWEVSNVEPKDNLVLCSDGLYSLVSEGEIANLLEQMSPQRACVKLVEIAKERGGYDNITVSIVPLGGQLRQEPPLGYKETRERKQRAKRAAAREPVAPAPSLVRTIGIVMVLSAMATLLTILVMAFLITQ